MKKIFVDPETFSKPLKEVIVSLPKTKEKEKSIIYTNKYQWYIKRNK